MGGCAGVGHGERGQAHGAWQRGARAHPSARPQGSGVQRCTCKLRTRLPQFIAAFRRAVNGSSGSSGGNSGGGAQQHAAADPERLALEDALVAHTAGAARANRMDDYVGMLRCGCGQVGETSAPYHWPRHCAPTAAADPFAGPGCARTSSCLTARPWAWAQRTPCRCPGCCRRMWMGRASGGVVR